MASSTGNMPVDQDGNPVMLLEDDPHSDSDVIIFNDGDGTEDRNDPPKVVELD